MGFQLNPKQVHRKSIDHPFICNPTQPAYPQSPHQPVFAIQAIKGNRRSVDGEKNVLPLRPPSASGVGGGPARTTCVRVPAASASSGAAEGR